MADGTRMKTMEELCKKLEAQFLQLSAESKQNESETLSRWEELMRRNEEDRRRLDERQKDTDKRLENLHLLTSQRFDSMSSMIRNINREREEHSSPQSRMPTVNPNQIPLGGVHQDPQNRFPCSSGRPISDRNLSGSFDFRGGGTNPLGSILQRFSVAMVWACSLACSASTFPSGLLQSRSGSYSSSSRRLPHLHIRCEKKKDDSIDVTVERYPYHSYVDSTSGQLEPASGARASIPGPEYWPEGTADQVRAARAPKPAGDSTGSPSYGKTPGSRRKSYKASSAASDTSAPTEVVDDSLLSEIPDDVFEEPKDVFSEYVVYQSEHEEENMSEYDIDKKSGRPHPFIDPKVKKPIQEPLTSEELWWNWRKPEMEQWSRWQRRRPDVETVFLKAMAESGQVKLYGEIPTLTETSLYRARRHLFKEERLKSEQEKLEEIGPIAYYSKWVENWKRDTSREAVQRHFEETGEDENYQLIEMFTHQTDREYRIMMGTDIRIKRDPLAMELREDQIKEIWGGDPVYPTINYIQDPDEVIDYRGPDFHEPTPNMLSFLKEHGKIITREELEKILSKEKTEEHEVNDMDEAMARAVDIGENDDEGEDSDIEADDEAEEKITRNWSVLKTTPQLNKSKEKLEKKSMSLDEAVEDSENLTDFLMDFDEDE